jgi:hypothetical protein
MRIAATCDRDTCALGSVTHMMEFHELLSKITKSTISFEKLFEHLRQCSQPPQSQLAGVRDPVPESRRNCKPHHA